MGFFNINEILNSSTTITYQKVIDTHNIKPKRICFNSFHKKALKEVKDYGDVRWALNVPFEESIGKIFEKETGFSLRKTRYGFWYPINEETEYEKVLQFKEKYNNTVFLRDNLDLSVSLSEHSDNDGNRTQMGELEYQAKWNSCSKSRIKLSSIVIDFIANTPYYKDCNYICAIPSSKPNKTSLPMKIARRVASDTDLIDLSSEITWKSEKNQLKELSFEERWNELVETDIEINIDKKIKSIILIDDLYQSGTTIQYVAMKLKEFGIKRVYGLTIVKARKDSDNC